MTRTETTITVPKLHDNQGNPTCCTQWGVRENTCPLLRVQGIKSLELCNWTGDELFRRDNGIGKLIPSSECPIHGDAK